MARQLRLEFTGGLYHLTARGNAQAAIYQDNDGRKLFLDLLERNKPAGMVMLRLLLDG
ncbi:MAG: hypothetical protein L3J84_01870 [Gammaproteobacteria bacterium]|nr:hypothetical protein [Gammaproteobacteria bacterium]